MPLRRSLAGKVVVVTGGSAGIGRASARAFAQRGACVALLARGAEGLAGACSDVEAAGGAALAIETDVADRAAVDAAAAQVLQRWGRIDVWVNNAMATVFAPFDEVDPDDFRRATEVTYLGAVWGTRAALAAMQRQGHGTIVQVGSALAYRSIPLQAAYCGAKSALRGFTDALRCELLHARSPVRLTMVQLSAFNTPQFEWARTTFDRRPQPVAPIYQPEVAAEAIVRAALQPRREWWVGWPAVKAIVGQRLAPGLLDRLAARRAWDGQLDNEALPPAHHDNLHAPVQDDRGAHGRFDGRARSWSAQATVARHRTVLACGGALLAVLAVAWRRRTRPLR